MSKQTTILKLERLVAGLHDTIIRLKNNPDPNIPTIEIGLIEQKLITFYDEVQTLKANALEQFSENKVDENEIESTLTNSTDDNVAEIKAQFEALKQQFGKTTEMEKLSVHFQLESTEIADDILEANMDKELENLIEIASDEMTKEWPEQEKRAEQISTEKPEIISSEISNHPIVFEDILSSTSDDKPRAEEIITEKKESANEDSISKKTPKTAIQKEGKTINQSNKDNLEKRTSLNDKFNNSKQPSLHEKLAQQKEKHAQMSKQMSGNPIKDIKKAINLNLQIRFQKELFDNDSRAYKRALDFLSKCSTFSEARSYIQHDLANNFKNWEDENAIYQEFMGLIKRRFI